MWKVSASATATITIDGLQLGDVFSMINIQLEQLRKVTEDQARTITNILNREESSKERYERNIAKLTDKVNDLERQMKQGGDSSSYDALISSVSKLEQRVDTLEKQTKLEAPSNIKDTLLVHTKSIDELQENITDISQKQPEAPVVNNDLDESIKQQISELSSKVAALQSQIKSTHDKMHRVEDAVAWSKSVCEKLSEDYTALLNNSSVLLDNLNSVQQKVHIEHEEQLHTLQETKLEKHDVEDMIYNILRREQAGVADDIDKLQTLTGELDRRLVLLASETHDGLDSLKKKMDKKIEFMTKWIIKHIKSLINDNEDEGDYTDIGKVRCLVCNQVSKQMDTDSPYIKPDFRNTLGVQHERKGGTRPTDDYVLRGGFKIPLQEIDTDPKYKLDSISPKRHSRSVKRLASLRASVSNIADDTPGFGEELDKINDGQDPHIPEVRPSTAAGEAGLTSEFYKEMEKYEETTLTYVL